jgi:hypothetical protein
LRSCVHDIKDNELWPAPARHDVLYGKHSMACSICRYAVSWAGEQKIAPSPYQTKIMSKPVRGAFSDSF